jgi:hypothetical protein
MSRRDLDARKSTKTPNLSGERSLADVADAWRNITQIYMDYENFCLKTDSFSMSLMKMVIRDQLVHTKQPTLT